MSKKKPRGTIYPLANATLPKLPQIIEVESANAYGVLLHTRESIEMFQINSGMKGNYTKEYQHHYWTAVARMNIDEQILDIAIPLVMFNYEQVISNGDIQFNLPDVTAASKLVEPLAMEKFKELKETPIYKHITEELGITTWSIIPLNTAHVHPGMNEKQSFSHIDLRKQADYPGVVYPLTTGNMIPSFSAIMVHLYGKAKIVQSEYRIFVGTEDKKTYIKGRCATIVKGYTPEPFPRVVQPEPVVQKLIDKIFDITPIQPTPIIQKEAVNVPSYELKNNLTVLDGKEVLDGLTAAWEATTYEPDTQNILKDNLITFVQQNKKVASKKQSRRVETRGSGYTTLFEKKEYIIKEGYSTWADITKETNESVEELYQGILEINRELNDEVELTDVCDKNDDYAYSYYQDYDNYEDFKKKTKNKIEETKKEKVYPIVRYNGVKYDQGELDKIKFLIEDSNSLSYAKMLAMSDYNIIGYYVNFVKKDI